jgi:glycogen debranching enzyme
VTYSVSGSRSLVTLRPSGDRFQLYRNHLVLSTGLDGFVRGGEQGLFAHEARVLSEFRYLINNEEPRPAGVSPVSATESLGYYVARPPGRPAGPPDRGSGLLLDDTQQTLELVVHRTIQPPLGLIDVPAGAAPAETGRAIEIDGLDETVTLTNYSDQPTSFSLVLIVEADFAGLPELRNGSLNLGHVNRSWDTATRRLTLDWHARHAFDHGVEQGSAADWRAMTIDVQHADGSVEAPPGALAFPVALRPGARWTARLRITPFIQTVAALPLDGREPARRERRFEFPGDYNRAAIASEVLHRAQADLEDLRLADLDRGPHAWTIAAGVPIYVALFGRDTLTASWQGAMLTPDMMRGSLQVLADLQGRTTNDWRDETPGRLLHEAHTGPLEVLNVNPRARYYGSVTTSGFFPLVLAQYWHWTADDEFVRSLLPQACAALRWFDEFGDLDGDGFVEYLTRSRHGVKHQGWKDSEDAIVYPDGTPAEPPIATCEEQAFVYVAKVHFAEMLWRLGERRAARRLVRDARRLRRRFNEAFWLPDQQYFAMALDARKHPVASIASNPGHCLAAGIIRREYARATADRLLQPDLFSGWGIRTLSSRHPAYNPFSYHRGSVWPVEQGSIALGFMRYGLHAHLNRLAAAVFDAASLFEHGRLPELFGGQPRDDTRAFPALYPQANSPQAWSASTVVLTLQALLGLYPYAPSKLLFVDPHLPAWLPDLVVRDLRVGDAAVTLRFKRTRTGVTGYRILKKTGEVHVVRQASPWSLTETFRHRARDLVASVLPVH